MQALALSERPTNPRLTRREAAVLGAVLKQPEPDEESGVKGFDPHYDAPAAKERWAYVLNNMVEMGWLEQAERERAWALASARAEGISIRTLANAAGLSPSRVHQLVATADLDAGLSAR